MRKAEVAAGAVSSGREDRGKPDEPLPPRGYDDATLVAYLGDVQTRARLVMQEHDISTAHITVMAQRAEQAIADVEKRAEFLRLLIDLHEFGREVRRRGLVAQARKEVDTDDIDRRDIDRGTKLFAPTEGALDSVSHDTTRDFFAALDR